MFVDWAGYLIVDAKYDENKKVLAVDVRFYAGNNNLYVGTQRLNRGALIESIENLSPLKLKYYPIYQDEKIPDNINGFENVNIPVLDLSDVSIVTIDGQKYIKNDQSADANDSLNLDITTKAPD